MKATRTLLSPSALLGAAVLAAAAVVGHGATSAPVDSGKLLTFDTMAGVPNGFTGTTNPIRGVNGGGLPWVVERGKGELRADGRLSIDVRGLVLDPDDPVVIERGLAGVNPAATFRAIVSCLTLDDMGNAITVNVQTEEFDADEAGDSKIRTRVELPSPCFAPVVFVTNAGGAWFASTGL